MKTQKPNLKKAIFAVGMLFLSSFIFTCCNRYNEEDFLCTCGKVEISTKEYIAMCIIPKEVTATSVNKLRMENHTKDSVSFGAAYVEYFNGNSWERINGDLMMYEYRLLRGRTVVEDVPHYSLYPYVERYNDAKTGKYRIKQSVFFIIKGISHQHSYCVAEFEVK